MVIKKLSFLFGLCLVIAFIGVVNTFLSRSVSGGSRFQSTVRIRSGDQHGSGVIVKQSHGGYWVITNHHVLANVDVHCIETSGLNVYAGIRVPIDNFKDDLALLWFNSKDDQVNVDFVVAAIEASNVKEPVTATGYSSGGEYAERPGLRILLLNEGLVGGYNITYTSDIDKGMSGGGIFNSSDRLIGINAIHNDPLWDAPRYFKSGVLVSESLNTKLDRFSIGLDSSLLLKYLLKASPKLESLLVDDLAGDDCSALER